MAVLRLSDVSGEAIPTGSGARLVVEYVDGRPSLEIDLTDDEAAEAIQNNLGIGRRRGSSLSEKRALHPRAYAPWTPEEEQRLIEMHRDGTSVRRISAALQRQPGGVRSRMRKLGLLG